MPFFSLFFSLFQIFIFIFSVSVCSSFLCFCLSVYLSVLLFVCLSQNFEIRNNSRYICKTYCGIEIFFFFYESLTSRQRVGIFMSLSIYLSIIYLLIYLLILFFIVVIIFFCLAGG